MNNKFVVIDLETNGNSPKKGDRIIQFAAVVIENNRIVDEYSTLLNPLQPITPFIEELTGITDKMVENAPLFEEVADKIVTLLEGAYFVAHNVIFDLTFLSEELEQAGYRRFFGPVLDTVELARIFFPTADSYKLNDLALQENIIHTRPHQADSDAFVTAELLLRMFQKLKELPLQTTKQLQQLSTGLKSDFDSYLQDLIEIKERKVEYVSGKWEIYRGITLRTIESPRVDSKKAVDQAFFPFSSEQIEEKMALILPSFAKREGQIEMMTSINEAFHQKKHGLIEAGTGVGKTLGYLLPAAYFATENKEQIIISTHTTQLQEQLWKKDLPILQEILPFPISYTVLKGRSHYISLDKFEVSLKEHNDNYDVILTKMQILVWLTETETGDKDELNLSSGGLMYWNRIKNDGNFSLPISKEWVSKDFYRRTRNAAQKAKLVITNHALFIRDITSEQKQLPSYNYVIIDEGHHFEKIASKHFGYQFSYVGVKLSIHSIGTTEQKQLLTALKKMVLDKDQKQFVKCNQLIVDLQHELEQLFNCIYKYVKNHRRPSNRKTSVRIRKDDSKQWKSMEHIAERLLFIFKDAHLQLKKMVESVLKDPMIHKTASQLLLLEQMDSVLKQWEEYMVALRTIFLQEMDSVSWLEFDQKSFLNHAVFYTQPYSVAERLQEHLFQTKNSVVFTSATITVNQSFDYYKKVLGLVGKDVIQVQIPSPFPYAEQVKLLIPTEVPELNTVPLEAFILVIAKQIIEIAQVTKGRMLVLFTSNDMLKKTYELMKESGELEEYAILAQGITNGSRMRLTRNFQRYDKAILLGTNSFWEGIDIPGEDLTCLIIVRLPFSSPEEPLLEAKNEYIKTNGGNPFLENSLPEAVLRFKQGFGRLIRTEKDRGFIVVFDRRIITTTYGNTFLQSIPKLPIVKHNLEEMLAFIKEWSNESS